MANFWTEKVSQQVTNNAQNRVLYFDVLRILAVFFVMVLHTSGENWHDAGVNTYEWSILNLFNGISRWCVPVFVMISGALFLNHDISIKKLYSKYILRLVIAFIVWSIAYSFIWNIVGQRDIIKFFRAIIKGHYHMWFIYMIIGLYMVIPFLKKIIEDNILTKYFIILAFIFALFVPEIISIIKAFSSEHGDFAESTVGQVHLKIVLGFTIYFIVGYCLNNVALSNKAKLIIYILGIVGFVSTVVFSLIISKKLDKPIAIFYSNESVNVFFEAVSIFVLIKNIISKSRFGNKTINAIQLLSKYSFGAYLIHALILTILNKFANLHSLTFNPILSIPLVSTTTFILSFGISAILNHIPIVKKYLV